MAAATALFYTLMVLRFVDYSAWNNRYYTAAYLLGLIPLSRLLAQIKFPPIVQKLALVYALLMSLQALLLNQDIRLLPVAFAGPDGPINHLKPVYGDLADRNRLYFEVWSGYQDVYDVFTKEIKRSDGLVFYNPALEGDVPFLYPFIKDRDAANTRIINARYGNVWDPSLCPDFRYVMVYKGVINDSNYTQIYSYGGPFDMKIYRRSKNDCT